MTLTFGAGWRTGRGADLPDRSRDHARTGRARTSDVIEKVAQWLIEAENPVFVVGSQVGIEGAYAEIVALAEKLSVPVAETMHSLYANFPNDHPLFLGELQAQRYPRKQDLLISFGESFTAGREDERGLTASGPRRTVHISHDPEALGRSFVPDLSHPVRRAHGDPRSVRCGRRDGDERPDRQDSVRAACRRFPR